MILASLLFAAEAMTFSADRIAADNVTRTLTASGHVVGVSKPFTVRGELMTRDVDGRMVFHDPTCATTCTNDVGDTHWNVTGEVAYKEKDYVILRNMWLRFYEVPIFWLPYLYYPLDTSCGFSWMVGYTGRWGAYLLTKYSYHLLGDPTHDETTWWLKGSTRFDLRYKQGLALGESLKWNLGDFGAGQFDSYYAWDEEGVDRHRSGSLIHSARYNNVDRERYSFSLRHLWEATERDTVRVQMAYLSDSYYLRDFNRGGFLWRSNIYTYENNGVFWEHLENNFSIGAEVSGRLNDFTEMTGRLPEFYFDLNPMPLFGLPVNYETQNRIGYLTRDPAEYGDSWSKNPFSFNPGPWAEYDAMRFDTYHRLTAPFKMMDDVVSVVPRVGYHGTFWSESGAADLTGATHPVAEEGSLTRSILEGGATFAARGEGWVNDEWRHMIEPYFDILVQKAWFSGDGDRPYIFDSIDASVVWEDQFAGRSRNLPYSYYGVTPGVRQAWEVLGEDGNLRQVLDLDFYAAFQFNETSYFGTDDLHKLAEVGKPNYGKHDCYVSPGFRLKWQPADDIVLYTRAEYDADNNAIASSDAGFRQKVSKDFDYAVTYALRDFRCWDYSSSSHPRYSDYADRNNANFQFIRAEFTHQVCDWLAWSPFVSWDLRERELDLIGFWVDYLTDCLGFRFQVDYRNSYVLSDGYEYDEDWSVGFYIYLRAFGTGNASFFH